MSEINTSLPMVCTVKDNSIGIKAQLNSILILNSNSSYKNIAYLLGILYFEVVSRCSSSSTRRLIYLTFSISRSSLFNTFVHICLVLLA
jgi:hypothetical protein